MNNQNELKSYDFTTCSEWCGLRPCECFTLIDELLDELLEVVRSVAADKKDRRIDELLKTLQVEKKERS